jgi:hypothetical protein
VQVSGASPRRYLSVSDWLRNERAPEMAADRAVSEQDCTKPINPGGNLRCRQPPSP